MDKDSVDEDYIAEREDKAHEFAHDMWGLISTHYEDNNGFTEEDMLEVFAGLGLFAGQAMDQAYYANKTLPCQLFGILSDIAHQSMYAYRYGIDLSELEAAKERSH